MRLPPPPVSFHNPSSVPVVSGQLAVIIAAELSSSTEHHSAVVPQWPVPPYGLRHFLDNCLFWVWMANLFFENQNPVARLIIDRLNTWIAICGYLCGAAAKRGGWIGSDGDSGGRSGITIIRLKRVMAITGLGRSTIYKYIDEGLFPRPVPLGGRAVGWVEQEIFDWVLSRVEMRDADCSR